MTPILIIVASLVLMFVAFRFIVGVIKFGVIGLIALVVIYVLATGKLG